MTPEQEERLVKAVEGIRSNLNGGMYAACFLLYFIMLGTCSMANKVHP